MLTQRLSHLGVWLFRHRWLVVAIWLGLLGLSFAAPLIQPRPVPLSESTGATGTEAYRVLTALREDFGFNLGNELALVYKPAAQTAGGELQPELDRQLERDLAAAFPDIEAQYALSGKHNPNLHLRLLRLSESVSFSEGQLLVPRLRAWLDAWEARSGQQSWLSGNLAFYTDIAQESEASVSASELIALGVAFVVLIACFGGLLAALLPLLIGAGTLILLEGLLRLSGLDSTPMSAILNSLLGLALAIDYSLFIVSRFQEEQARRLDPEAALARTLARAGRTILVSAAIMLVSIAVLLLPDLSGSRIMARNLLLVIGLSVCSSVLVLPALLALAPRLLAWPAPLSGWIRRYDSYVTWKRFATRITARPGSYFLMSLLLLGALCAPLAGMRIWDPGQTLASTASESRQGYELLQADGWGGQMVPLSVIVRAHKGDPIDSDAGLAHIHALSRYLAGRPDVAGVQSLASLTPWADQETFIGLYRRSQLLGNLLPATGPSLINERSGRDKHLISVYPADVMDVAQSQRIADGIRTWARAHPGFETLVGGVGERAWDFTEALYGPTPLMLGLVLAGIFILLFAYLRALILPVKAAVLNFVPIAGAFGVLTLVYQHGWLSGLLNTPRNGAITSIIPITLFCIVFGLSMDYEVLILSRISEAYAETGDVRAAVIEGMARSGSVITGAALIFLSVFMPAVFSQSPAVKELGIGIVSAIAIDATLLRLLLVPSFMLLLGRWNWWSPWQKAARAADAGSRAAASERPESPD